MSGSAPAMRRTNQLLTAVAWRRVIRDQPLIPLLVLLAILALAFVVLNPHAVISAWVSVTLRAAVPLAILAGCQTLTMLTGGIDLSVAAIASMSGFVVAALLTGPGTGVGIVVALAAAGLAGLVTGIGVGVFRVHPLIMTLGMGLIVFGGANAFQLLMVKTGTGVPAEIRWIGSTTFAFVPASLIVFVPLAALIMVGLRRTGYGRLLYAIGDNPIAARLSGARSWQVLIVLYVISALMAAVAGFLISGLTNVASVALADTYLLPSVAAAVIGGTSILGGRGGYAGTIVGALILQVLISLLSSLSAQFSVLGQPDAIRQIVFGALVVLVAAGYARATYES
jgi:ribose transport system permease protein